MALLCAQGRRDSPNPGALLMLSCRSHHGAGFCREVQSFPPRRAGESCSRWSPRHTVEEPQGQQMKTQVPRPLQRAQHVTTTACQVVLLATMALATQLALVALSVLESLAAPVTRLIPRPQRCRSQVAQPLPFRRSRGHPTFQGLVETLHLEPEF
nr:unnamed protein product [Rangifer tarandus platyrhynchus]